jgi:hypothetical protein
MAQTKTELKYDKFKALCVGSPRPVDADFEQTTKDLKTLPKPHETHAETRNTRTTLRKKA